MLRKLLVAPTKVHIDHAVLPEGSKFVGAPYTSAIDDHSTWRQAVDVPDPDEQSPLLKRMINRRL